MLTIIIPVYNNETTIERCLISVCKQTYSDIEIIVVNDGSVDNSEEKILSIKDNRIKYLSQQNMGPSVARNKGLELSKGDYILFVDADDYLKPDMLEILFTTAQKNNAQIVNCNIYRMHSDKKFTQIREPYKENQNWQDFYKNFLLHGGLCSLWNKLIKKTLFEEIRLYEDIRLCEDSTAFLRLLPLASNISHVRKPLYVYDLTHKGISSHPMKNNYDCMIATKRVIDYYKEKNIELPLPEYFLRLRICYYTLFFMPLDKANRLGYLNYFKLAQDFYNDYHSIIHDKNFKVIALKYRLFTIVYNSVYYKFYKLLENKNKR